MLTARRFVQNAVRVQLTRNRVLEPMLATYHVTSHCNLNCIYCEDFGLRRNERMNDAMLDLHGAKQLLRVVRTATENIILTGGETLLHPAIEDIVAYAADLRFRHIALITNGLLLPKREGLLRYLSRLIVSLDSLDTEAWDHVLAAGSGMAERIIRIVGQYAGLQERYGYRIVINCVVLPGTIGMARNVIRFCIDNNLSFSISPQGVRDQPHEALQQNPEYRELIREVIKLKQAGANAVGSNLYLKHMLQFDAFQCYPTLNARITQNGDLVYPCRPISDRNDGCGGVAVNLLEFESFQDAFALAVQTYGPPPEGCRSCFQQCFADPSLVIQRPLSAFSEFRRYQSPRA